MRESPAQGTPEYAAAFLAARGLLHQFNATRHTRGASVRSLLNTLFPNGMPLSRPLRPYRIESVGNILHGLARMQLAEVDALQATLKGLERSYDLMMDKPWKLPGSELAKDDMLYLSIDHTSDLTPLDHTQGHGLAETVLPASTIDKLLKSFGWQPPKNARPSGCTTSRKHNTRRPQASASHIRSDYSTPSSQPSAWPTESPQLSNSNSGSSFGSTSGSSSSTSGSAPGSPSQECASQPPLNTKRRGPNAIINDAAIEDRTVAIANEVVSELQGQTRLPRPEPPFLLEDPVLDTFETTPLLRPPLTTSEAEELSEHSLDLVLDSAEFPNGAPPMTTPPKNASETHRMVQRHVNLDAPVDIQERNAEALELDVSIENGAFDGFDFPQNLNRGNSTILLDNDVSFTVDFSSEEEEQSPSRDLEEQPQSESRDIAGPGADDGQFLSLSSFNLTKRLSLEDTPMTELLTVPSQQAAQTQVPQTQRLDKKSVLTSPLALPDTTVEKADHLSNGELSLLPNGGRSQAEDEPDHSSEQMQEKDACAESDTNNLPDHEHESHIEKLSQSRSSELVISRDREAADSHGIARAYRPPSSHDSVSEPRTPPLSPLMPERFSSGSTRRRRAAAVQDSLYNFPPPPIFTRSALVPPEHAPSPVVHAQSSSSATHSPSSISEMPLIANATEDATSEAEDPTSPISLPLLSRQEYIIQFDRRLHMEQLKRSMSSASAAEAFDNQPDASFDNQDDEDDDEDESVASEREHSSRTAYTLSVLSKFRRLRLADNIVEDFRQESSQGVAHGGAAAAAAALNTAEIVLHPSISEIALQLEPRVSPEKCLQHDGQHLAWRDRNRNVVADSLRSSRSDAEKSRKDDSHRLHATQEESMQKSPPQEDRTRKSPTERQAQITFSIAQPNLAEEVLQRHGRQSTTEDVDTQCNQDSHRGESQRDAEQEKSTEEGDELTRGQSKATDSGERHQSGLQSTFSTEPSHLGVIAQHSKPSALHCSGEERHLSAENEHGLEQRQVRFAEEVRISHFSDPLTVETSRVEQSLPTSPDPLSYETPLADTHSSPTGSPHVRNPLMAMTVTNAENQAQTSGVQASEADRKTSLKPDNITGNESLMYYGLTYGEGAESVATADSTDDAICDELTENTATLELNRRGSGDAAGNPESAGTQQTEGGGVFEGADKKRDIGEALQSTRSILNTSISVVGAEGEKEFPQRSELAHFGDGGLEAFDTDAIILSHDSEDFVHDDGMNSSLSFENLNHHELAAPYPSSISVDDSGAYHNRGNGSQLANTPTRQAQSAQSVSSQRLIERGNDEHHAENVVKSTDPAAESSTRPQVDEFAEQIHSAAAIAHQTDTAAEGSDGSLSIEIAERDRPAEASLWRQGLTNFEDVQNDFYTPIDRELRRGVDLVAPFVSDSELLAHIADRMRHVSPGKSVSFETLRASVTRKANTTEDARLDLMILKGLLSAATKGEIKLEQDTSILESSISVVRIH